MSCKVASCGSLRRRADGGTSTATVRLSMQDRSAASSATTKSGNAGHGTATSARSTCTGAPGTPGCLTGRLDIGLHMWYCNPVTLNERPGVLGRGYKYPSYTHIVQRQERPAPTRLMWVRILLGVLTRRSDPTFWYQDERKVRIGSLG